MGNAVSSTCRGMMNVSLALFLIIFLVTLFLAIIYWKSCPTATFSPCLRLLMDIIVVLLSLGGVIYLGYLVARCRCEGTCGEGSCVRD